MGTATAGKDITAEETDVLYAAHVNEKWVHLLKLLGMDVTYTHCTGVDLYTDTERHVLDFLSGYCVYNMGHNHPGVIAALEDELLRLGPTMLQSHVPDLAAELASRLTGLAGGRLSKVFFTSSGSEGIETVIKFARAQTGRDRILYCHGAFHGLTCGALSLMGDPWWRKGFGPMLPGTDAISFGDAEALERTLAAGRYAAFVLEPIQAEAGIVLPESGYLQAAQASCRKAGTLLVLDEVQTGMYRTGPFLAAHHFKVEPDMVVLAKALSGGLVPCGAVLMSEAVHRRVYSSLSRAYIHASTFGENNLAMRAGLATLDVMESEKLGRRAEVMGERLRRSLATSLSSFDMVESVRGLGLLNGIVFRQPRSAGMRIAFEAFRHLHQGMFGQMLVSELFRSENILTQMCGNNHMVLKVAPPLVLREDQMQRFVAAVTRVVEKVHAREGFWKHGLSMVKGAVAV
ncbi:MAG: aspartate aminotransferase family protein [Acidobacteriota bacterium]